MTLIRITCDASGSDSSAIVFPNRAPVKRSRFVSQSKHRPYGCKTAITEPAVVLNAPSSATRGALDPYVGKMNKPIPLRLCVGALSKPSSRQLQFSPDATIVDPDGVGVGVGDGELGDDPQAATPIAARRATTKRASMITFLRCKVH